MILLFIFNFLKICCYKKIKKYDIITLEMRDLMFEIGDFVVYKRDVCRIKKFLKNYIKENDYYELVPILDDSLKIVVPVSSHFIRGVLTKEEVDKIIDIIPYIEVIDVNDKLIESEYKKLLQDGDHIGLIKIIKTTYLRNEDRLNNKKKISEKDDNYFNLAEMYLYSEFAVALDVSFEDAKDYVVERVKEKCN